MAEVTRKELVSNINKGLFERIYLFYGDEKLYIKSDCERLVTKLAGKHPSEFNYRVFNDSYTLDDIASAVQSVPFMSEYNIVKVCDLDFNALNKTDLEKLTVILKSVPDSTVLILTMPTLEQNAKKLGAGFTKVLSYVKKNGCACAFGREGDITLARQIVKWADTRSIKIERADAYKIIEYVGDDLNAIKNELDKLCNYVGDGGIITSADIELLTPKKLEANIYHLADAVVSENGNRAYSILDALFYQKADPETIINVIGNAYIDFYRARTASECSVPLSGAAAEFGYGNRAFVLKNAVNKIKNIPTSALRESLDAIVSTTADFHSTSLNKRAALEKLIAQLLISAGKR